MGRLHIRTCVSNFVVSETAQPWYWSHTKNRLSSFGLARTSPHMASSLIQKNDSLHPVKKSHLFRGHDDPLFRCPRSKNGIKWEPDTHKWVSRHIPIRSRVSFDSPDSSNDLENTSFKGIHDTLPWVSGSHLIPFFGRNNFLYTKIKGYNDP